METEDPWRVFYEDPEEQTAAYNICDNKDPEERICPAQVSGLKAQVRAENIKEAEEFQTMLLTPKEKPDHILVSAKPENGDIPVGYVPFVIGKHTGLADHILDKPTVSRFHVRIMEKGGDYFLTDLNSTNGTKVNGKLLAANEEIMLKEGDTARGRFLGDIAEIRLTMEKNYASIINKKSAYRHRRGGIRNGRRQLYFL